MTSQSELDNDDNNIELWKMKRLIKNLQSAEGNGTSMISLIIASGSQIAPTNKILTEEYGAASNIKSRVNRQSVQDAITSAQQRLKRYNKTPPNGLVVYVGTVGTESGREKRVAYDFEPFKPIKTKMYLCDSKFHVGPLAELLESNDKYGFIIMDGSSTLFGTVCGNDRETLQTITVELPKKQKKGGQSSMRFARLRLEARHNYIRKVAELSIQHFITNDLPNVKGLVLAGSAEFKEHLAKSDLFDKRLAKIVIKIVDVSYGLDNGFNQAIELSQDTLAGVKFVQERKLLSSFFEKIALDTGEICYGINDTMTALDLSAVETLIIWEDLPIIRYIVKDTTNEVMIVDNKVLCLEQGKLPTNVKIMESEPLVEWLAQNYKDTGAKLEFVSNKSQEGSQFCLGFGGIGGILRYKVDFSLHQEHEDGDEDSSDSDGDLLEDFGDELDAFM
jgi:peptide chain release factor subunit 1